MAEETLPPICDQCNARCHSGYEVRTFGEADAETGYRDQEIVCNRCLDESDAQENEDERYAEGDRVLTGMFEES